MLKSVQQRPLIVLFLWFFVAISQSVAFSGYGHPEDEDDRYFRSSREMERDRGYGPRFRDREGPHHIALLLPMTGKHADAAKAIREGFLASYYKYNQGGRAQPTVRVYDTTRGNIRQVYFRAVNEGAKLVIGPLAKEDVYHLSFLPMGQMSVPILALNTHPQTRPSHSMYQFSLAPEDEAAQIADKAAQRGYKTASIIVPDNDWGKRTAKAFIQQWQQHGGQILKTVYSNPSQDQAAAVRRLLGVDLSQKRQPKESAQPNEPAKPQRPAVDVIVMAAPPEQARQWKPLFDFYYAEEVPVFATSSIYSGNPNPKLDRDMNGVIFCDMPWLLERGRAHELRELLPETAQDKSSQYNRLFAMGVDAYRLSQSLENGQYRVMEGATGTLKIDQNNRVKRQLSCAQMRDGVPQPI